MKRLLTVALLCASTGALAADKTAPKPTTTPAPKAESKDAKPLETKNLKVEEPDQKDPKNKDTDTKAKGEVNKDSF
ncbi:hypothetical protein [Melittangium boletus]|uniref:hypothetical protein n=1 Tax=Melittangium boletus TaxID=83453 RepID=UPI003DA4FCA5